MNKKYNFISRTCWILLGFSLAEAIGGGLVYYIAYFFKVAANFSNLQIGQLGFSIGLGSLLGSFIGAFLSDKVSPQRVILFSFTLVGTCFFLIAKKLSFGMNIPIVFIMGLFSNLFMNSNTLMLLRSSPASTEQSRVVQNIRVVSENTGNGVAMLLIMFCSASYYAEVFNVIGVTFILLTISAFKLLLPIATTQPKKTNIEKTSEKKEKFFKKVQFFNSIASVLLIGLVFGFQKISYPLAMHSYFSSTVLIGLLFAIDPFFIAFSSLKINSYFKNLSPPSLMAFGSLLMAIGTLMLASFQSAFMIIISTLIFLTGEILFMPSSQVFTNESVPTNKEGFAVNLRKAAFTSGGMLGAWGAGYLLEHYSFFTSWSISSIFSACAFILLVFSTGRSGLFIEGYTNAACKK